MTEPDDPVTEVADTAIAPGDKSAEPADLAWSLDRQDSETTPSPVVRETDLGGAGHAAVCVIVAVVTWFSITLYHQKSSRPMPPSPKSSAASPAPKPAAPPPARQSSSTEVPPPAGVTTQAPSPANVAAKQQDAFFLQLLGKRGWPLTPPTEPLIWEGRNVCALMEGPSHLTFLQVTRQIAAQHSTTVDTADMFVDAAVTSYCPHQLGY